MQTAKIIGCYATLIIFIFFWAYVQHSALLITGHGFMNIMGFIDTMTKSIVLTILARIESSYKKLNFQSVNSNVLSTPLQRWACGGNTVRTDSQLQLQQLSWMHNFQTTLTIYAYK